MNNPNSNFETRYQKLNEKQKEAVDALEGPVLVVAGPGSGKTEIIALRIANLVYKGLAKPDEILCLTFTESASQNMLERLIKIMGSTAYKVPIFTFHAFCTNLIARYPEHFFDAHRFEPISELRQNEILESIFKKLRYGHPLFGYHEEYGYTYFKDVKTRIKNFKEAGLNPGEVKEKVNKNKKDLEELKEVLAKVPESLRSKEGKEKFADLEVDFLNSGTELGKVYANFLEKEIENENLSKAKTRLFEKDESDNFRFKEEKYLEKLEAVAELYREYQNELYRQGLFDFDDMIIYVKDSLVNNNTLRAEVEETYQYILLDEFQDTNLAQLKLVESITNNIIHEGRPEVFVVGDDDQSIFKFQGAELNNIFHFKEMYKDVKTIVLTDNYRSTQKVLNFAKSMIEKAGERLTKIDKTLIKDLLAKNTELREGNIYLNSFDEKAKEYLFIAKEIKKILDSGVDAKEIAVISRKHAEIQELLPYLDTENVPYNYERKESVFEQNHIEPLIKICKFLETVGDGRKEEGDDLLPEILSYEFLDIDRVSIWEISREAYKENKSWLEVMLESKNKKIKDFAEFLIELGIQSKTAPLEMILDILVGSKGLEIPQDENEDEYWGSSKIKLKSNFVSNYKEFYFGEDAMKDNLASYIHFLSSLRVFIYALREYKKGEKLLVSDLSNFIKLHKDYNVALLNKTNFVGDKSAINLMTVHKSKGLEFEYVFLIGSDERVWKSKGFPNKIPLPLNMPFSRSLDDEDDFLRLFFVGLTRAKHTIYMTHSEDILSFLSDEKENHSLENATENIENLDLKNGLKIYNIPPFAKNEKALLENLVENYKLSPTHLNNFIDITSGGPKLFLEQNLLQFPQVKTPSNIYGTAIHAALEKLYYIRKVSKKFPPLEAIEEVFEKEIKKGRLLKSDEEDLIQKGKKRLHDYYYTEHAKVDQDAEHSHTELDLGSQNVYLEDAQIKGKIDRVVDREDGLEVIDIKSGKSFKDFEAGSIKKEDYENIKKHKYKQQLMFYKLLLENSNFFKNKIVSSGAIKFVDEDTISSLTLDFEKDITREEWDDFKKLVVNTFKIIKNPEKLSQIDISNYPKNIEGVLEFERDIIENKA